MKNVGLIVAVEIDAIKTLFGTPLEEYKEHGFFVSIYERHGLRLIVMHTGIGEIASSSATMLLIDKYKVEMIANFGLVGALTEQISSTPIALVRYVVDSDMDVSAIDHIPVGVHEGFKSPYLSLDKKLIEEIRKFKPDLPLVTCVSGNQFLEGEGKARAYHLFKGDICDMELAGIAYAAYADRVPVMSLKIVSDSVFGGATEYYEAKERASKECLMVLDDVLRYLAN